MSTAHLSVCSYEGLLRLRIFFPWCRDTPVRRRRRRRRRSVSPAVRCVCLHVCWRDVCLLGGQVQCRVEAFLWRVAARTRLTHLYVYTRVYSVEARFPFQGQWRVKWVMRSAFLKIRRSFCSFLVCPGKEVRCQLATDAVPPCRYLRVTGEVHEDLSLHQAPEHLLVPLGDQLGKQQVSRAT